MTCPDVPLVYIDGCIPFRPVASGISCNNYVSHVATYVGLITWLFCDWLQLPGVLEDMLSSLDVRFKKLAACTIWQEMLGASFMKPAAAGLLRVRGPEWYIAAVTRVFFMFTYPPIPTRRPIIANSTSEACVYPTPTNCSLSRHVHMLFCAH